MSQDAVERLLGRLLTDDWFRQQAAQCLATACHAEGYLLSDEELHCIGANDLQQFAQVSAMLDQGIKRFRRDPNHGTATSGHSASQNIHAGR